jgi:CRP-like cAMP-binding protein
MNEIGRISHVKSHALFKKGQVIFHEGTNAVGLYCVNSGHIKVHKHAADGHEQIIRISRPGDFLGYSSLLSSTRYAASATALEDCVVCLVPKQEIFKLFKENNRFAEGMIEMIGRSLQSSYAQMANLAYKPVRGRMAEALLLLHNTFKDNNNPSGTITISRDDLASIVGTVKETAIRTLKDFKDSHLIETDGPEIRILDPAGLVQVSELYD